MSIKYEIKNLERKIEIALLTFEKAKRALNKPDFITQEEYLANYADQEQRDDETNGAYLEY